MFGQCIFSSHGGGGGGGKEGSSFGVPVWNTTEGEGVGGGIPLPRWGLFGNLGTKKQVLVRYKC